SLEMNRQQAGFAALFGASPGAQKRIEMIVYGSCCGRTDRRCSPRGKEVTKPKERVSRRIEKIQTPASVNVEVDETRGNIRTIYVESIRHIRRDVLADRLYQFISDE